MDLKTCTCCSCGCRLRSGVELTAARLKLEGDMHYASALFNPNKKAGENFTLCKPCYEHERKMIGEKGTNDIPELLARYSPSERLDEE